MKLNCVKCGAEIPAENMNLDRMVAKCAVCNSVFSFDNQFSGRALSRQVQIDVPQPSRVRLENEAGVLTIRLSWFSNKILFFTVFAIFWNGIMFTVAGGALLSLFTESFSGFPLIIFATPHFWAGLAMIYYVLAGYLNETRVTVDHNLLEVRHGPLPFWGNKAVDVTDIVQLYAKHNYSMWRNNWSGHYELHAVTGKNRHEKVLSGWDNPDYAVFVEQEVEHFLGIEDYPVRGEYGRV